MRRLPDAASAVVLTLAVLAAGCSETPGLPTQSSTGGASPLASAVMDPGPYELGPPVYDISTAPDGSILLVHGAEVQEIRKGAVEHVADIPVSTPPDQQARGLFATANGVAAVGRGSFFVSTGGGDLALESGIWHVSRGQVRLVGDIHAFETDHDPDALEGPQWKDQRCEQAGPFTAGPQSNPYHVAALGGDTALVGDAAGNSVLAVSKDGDVDWVAVVTPPVADGSASTDPADWLTNPNATYPDLDCYAQPVPTSVAIGPDGAYYVGELTGSSADQPAGATGVSRVWRIEPGARHVVCPSEACTPLLTGLTAVIDLAFGPDGHLYVAEYNLAGGLMGLFGGPTAGDLLECDVDTGTCDVAAADLTLPSALAFDKRGDLWLLTNNIGTPTVERVDLD